MIPKKDVEQLMQYYKSELTENALLNKATHLAVKKHKLLSDPNVRPAIVNAKTKPISRELAKLTKQLRTFPTAGVGGGVLAEEEVYQDDTGMVTGPLQQWLKKMIKRSPSTTKPKIPVPIVKNETPLTKTSVPTTTFVKKGAPSTSTASTRKESYKERLTELLKELGKSKQQKGKRKTEVERLQPFPGWEDWAKGKKLRQRLDYDEEDD